MTPEAPACAPARSFDRGGRAIAVAVLLTAAAFLSDAGLKAGEPPQFNRDVLPILSDHCFGCHGPDESSRKGGLRLDTQEGALATIDRHQPQDSEFLIRIASNDPAIRMPPPKSNKPLTEKQVTTLREWVTAGAVWDRHWAFEKPVRPPVPPSASGVDLHPVDAFVRARLAREGLVPHPPATRTTLIRRVSFDLTGLPPTPDEVARFLKDDSSDAWPRLVDRLLASPHYGERMAHWWLDLARYADTDGFQGDETRTNWPWRDWVVGALNRNQPFDRFTIEQFAGDLLPESTPEQKLATCFHRNHMTNGEGGRDPEESRIDYVMDRINTTGTVWLGLTLGCCQCHSHKFDPISQSDYYGLFAFFNSIDETGSAGRSAKPYLRYSSPFASRAVEEAQRLVDERAPREALARREAEQPFAQWLDEQLAAVRADFNPWTPLFPAELRSVEGTSLVAEADGTVQAHGANPRQDDYRFAADLPANLGAVSGIRLEVFPYERHTVGGYSRGASGHFILTDVKLQVRRPDNSQIRDIALANAAADFAADPKLNDGYGDVQRLLDDDPRNGWTTRGEPGENEHAWRLHRAVFALAEPLILERGEQLVFEMRHRSTRGDASIGRFRISVTDQAGQAVRSVEPMPLELLSIALRNGADPARLDGDLRSRLLEQFLSTHTPYQVQKEALDRANAQLAEVRRQAEPVDVMVLAEREQPRETHLLVRGVWDKKGELLERSVPQAIAAWPGDVGKTRLGLAQWLVARDNPLTARVIVNHLWQICFGAGLVRTPDDFGLQGERPTHPELLDWLAVEFMESGWNVKHLLRLIVTSETYRQSSQADEAHRARDPENRLLARTTRFRLPSWMLRDAALHAAGLLNPAVGGPPVRPYQPDGVWEEMFMGRFHYQPSEGPAQYRRTLYAFWRRAVGPTFLFDAAQRRVCEVRTVRTNTPLHALTLLNDRNYLEAAGALAALAMQDEGDFARRAGVLYERVLARPPEADELAILEREWNRAAAHYRSVPTDRVRLLEHGPEQLAGDHSPELASWMLLASLVLNLDEALNHE